MFKDFNFKLAVIAELMENEELKENEPFYKNFVSEFSKLPSKQPVAFEPVPERLTYLQNLELSPESLASVTRFSPCTLHKIYKMLVPDWDEADKQFYISSLEDLALLPNIDTVDLFELCHAQDLKPLMQLKKLKYVDIDIELVKPGATNKEVIQYLKSKKMKVYVQ